ncbi:MAG: DNA polymerase I [Bacteriovoracaceae bacterium]|nr:DNA polymerase I [Bacteriovoracaceae bacterium]
MHLPELTMANKSSTLYLIDISNFIFRAFYAVRSLTAPDKTPVNAVYGVFTMLLKFIEDKKPDYLLIAQDSKEKSFRTDLYPDYKANRSAPPEELIPQFALLEELYDHLLIPRLRVPGVEADDILASFATQFYNEFEKVVIISGDKDLLQLVGGNIVVWDSMKDKTYLRDDVFEKMGVYPEQVVDYLSLVGDASDNVPGVKGIGDKGAQKLIAEYGSLDKILESTDVIKNAKSQNALKEHRADAILSRELINVKKDMALPFDVSKLKYTFKVTPGFIDYLKRLGFKSQLARFSALPVASQSTPSTLIEEIPTSFLDFTSKEFIESKEIALAFCNHQFYAKSKNHFFLCSDAEMDMVLDEGKFKNKTIYHQNPKDFFKRYIQHKNIKNNISAFFDVPLAQFLVEENIFQSFEENTDQLISENQVIDNLTHLFDSGEKLKLEIAAQTLDEIYYHLDLPLNYVLATMEVDGIILDLNFLKSVENSFSQKLAEIEKSIQLEAAGMEVNLKSPKQVATLLFEKLGLPTLKMNKTGPSTDSSVLAKLSQMKLSPVPESLLKYREIEKLLSTYVTSLPQLVDTKGRVHTSFRQTVAATGRLSSDTPNLQNIPIKTENGRLIRKAFVAPTGFQFLSADYSQIELRILAHFSQDPFMVKAFHDNIDIHTMTAAEVFGTPVSQVTSDQRSRAKAINFGLLYGQTSFGLSESLGISQSEAKTYIKHYFDRFSSVKAYLDSLKEKAMESGYSETLLGRKRKIPNINSQNRLEKSFAERVAINSPIQGTAADIIKRTMLVVQDFLVSQNLKSRMLLQIHDELLLECPDHEISLVKEKVVKIMESTVVLSVPLKVDTGVGVNWSEMN